MTIEAGSGVEVELTYVLSEPGELRRFMTTPRLGPFTAASLTRPTQFEDRYVDTADGGLARAGYAARLRRGPKKTVLTVKSTATARGALQRRTELEGPADVSLDALSWPSSSARSLVLELCGDAPLREVVTIRQLRRTRALRAGSTRAELSLDEVEVVRGGEIVDRFTELEAELREGDEAPLLELAASFALEPILVPAGRSKLERALEAVMLHEHRATGPVEEAPAPGPSVPESTAAESNAAEPAAAEPPAAEGAPIAPPVIAPPRTPGVTATDTLAEAGRKVLRFHFARLRLREAGTRSGKNPEDLHGMRVATRRMRAAWRVFGDGFRPRRTMRLRNRLRELATRLGAVRDLDVLIAGFDGYASPLDAAERAGLLPLVAAWREQREIARRLLIRELDSEDYTRLVDEYEVFVRTEGQAAADATSPTAPSRIRDRAASRIWDAYEHVRSYDTVLPWADVATLHQLRISGKWLRYTLEFFREALGPEAPDLIARIVAIQDHLGLLHDADVTASLVRSFLVEQSGRLDPEETQAIGRYLHSREQEVARLRRSFSRVWRPVAGTTFRRALGRAVAAL